MTYQIYWNGKNNYGETITVSNRSEILSALKQAYLMEGPNYIIRHYDMFSDVYENGRIVISVLWID